MASDFSLRNGAGLLAISALCVAFSVVANGADESEAPYVDKEVQSGVDFYVSAVDGDDSCDGLTAATAFKTLDRAYSVATNGQTVGVLPGTYPYPSFYCRTNFNYCNFTIDPAPRRIHSVALAGSDFTFIDASLVDVPVNARMAGSYGENGGEPSSWTLFEGFTFRGCRPYSSNASRAPYWLIWFRDCVFDGLVCTNRNTAATWNMCILEGCRIKDHVVTGQGADYGFHIFPAVFSACYVEGCEIDVTSTHTNNTQLYVSSSSGFGNCYFAISGQFAGLGDTGWPQNFSPVFSGCTIVSDKMTWEYDNLYMWKESYAIKFDSCNIGIDDFPFSEVFVPTNGPNTVNKPHLVTSCAVMAKAAAQLSIDGKKSWGAVGYGAAAALLDPIPEIAEDAEPSAVTNAIESAGFSDEEAIKTAIGGSAKEYAAFKAWAGGVGVLRRGAASGESAVIANTNAAAAYLLGASRLFENAPKIEFEDMKVDADAGGGSGIGLPAMTLSVVVKDGENAVNCAAEKVAAMFEATRDPGDWSGAAKLTPVVHVAEPVDGDSAAMRFTVKPGEGQVPKAFLRIRR